MPTNRRETPDLPSAPDLRPAARPIDTYEMPTRANVAKPPETNALTELGRSLSSLSRPLNQYAKETAQAEARHQQARGEIAWLSGERWVREAVRDNKFPPDMHPQRIRGIQRSALHTLAAEYAAHLHTQWMQSGEVRNSEDPTAFGTFLENTRASFLQDMLYTPDNGYRFNPRDFSDVFAPMMLQAERTLQSIHLERRTTEWEREVEERGLDAVTALLNGLPRRIPDAAPTPTYPSLPPITIPGPGNRKRP